MCPDPSGSRAAPFPFVALTALLLPGCVLTDAGASVLSQQQESYTLQGQRVAVYNLAGHVEVVGYSGADVAVEVTRRGADRSRLSIEVDGIDGREALRVIYPEDRIRYLEQGGGTVAIRVDGDGTFGDGASGLFADRVRISRSGSGPEAWADLRILVPEGREAEVYVGAGEVVAESVAADLRLAVSAGAVTASAITGALTVDVGSGSVAVTDVEGPTDVDTGSGSVEVRGVFGSRLLVDTGSGSVRGGDILVDWLEVDTGSGRIVLDAVDAPRVHVDTGSGSVSLEVLGDVDELEIDTGSGGVELAVSDDVGAEIEVDTGSGRISADVPVQIRSSRRGSFEGVIGDGQGDIEIDTGSGGVRIAPL